MADFTFVGILTSLNVLALSAALWGWRVSGGSSLRRRLASLKVEFLELQGEVDELRLTWQRFRGREGMRELRDARRAKQSASSGVADDVDLASTATPPVRAPNSSKRALRLAMGVPENPVAAQLGNLKGEFTRGR